MEQMPPSATLTLEGSTIRVWQLSGCNCTVLRENQIAGRGRCSRILIGGRRITSRIDSGRVPVDLFIVSAIPAGWKETNPSTEVNNTDHVDLVADERLSIATATAAITVT